MMPLTYQPFAHVPEMDRLARDLSINLSDNERRVSGAISFGLGIASFQCSGPLRWLLLIAGAALGSRAISGHCPLVRACDANAAQSHPVA